MGKIITLVDQQINIITENNLQIQCDLHQNPNNILRARKDAKSYQATNS